MKPVYKDHPRDQQNMFIIHRWSLYAGSTAWKVYTRVPVKCGLYKQVVFKQVRLYDLQTFRNFKQIWLYDLGMIFRPSVISNLKVYYGTNLHILNYQLTDWTPAVLMNTEIHSGKNPPKDGVPNIWFISVFLGCQHIFTHVKKRKGTGNHIQ